MSESLVLFERRLKSNKNIAVNTVTAYLRDVREYCEFLGGRGDIHEAEATEADIAAWLLVQKKSGKTAATVNRKLASIRAFYKFLLREGMITQNPSVSIKTPKIAPRELEYLSVDEVEKLLTQPDDSVRGIRDKAILELLYATGLRVSELVETDISDLNMHMGFVKCSGEHGKARIIPLGRPARAALERYLYEDRGKLLRNNKNNENALFLNYYGERLTRQAMWKIMRFYATAAGITKKITPQIFRNSFAVHMIKNGADVKSIQELLGHEDIAATQIYLSVTKNRIKDVYDSTHPRA
jgi:integrase/recombinase XerD